MGNRIVAGVDLGGTKCLGVLADLSGQVVFEYRLGLSETGGAEPALARVCQRLAGAAQQQGHQLVAAGIGVPAVLDPVTGLAVRGPNTGWDGFDVTSLTTDLKVPLHLDNDVNLAAIGEQRVGWALGYDTFAVLAIGTGLGGAVVGDRQLLRGAHQGAGELGLLPAPASAGVPARDLEGVVSGVGIAAAARSYLQKRPDAAAELGLNPDARSVLAAATAGSPHAHEVLRPVWDGIAAAIVALVAVADPALVIFDGSVGKALDPFRERIARLINNHVSTVPTLTCSALTPTATVVGAVQQALALLPGSVSHNHEGVTP
ncbi:MAG: ROK family protein [Propioniciclava sp.]